VRIGDARIYVIAPAHLKAGRLADLIGTLGADIVQLRDRQLAPAALLAEARACAEAARRAGCLFVVNDDPVLARDAGADGVHLGQDDGSIAAAREIMGGGIVGRTTRGGAALAEAAAEGADYASVSPVWETATHPTRPPVGLAAVADAARTAQLPWFALGGIDQRRAFRVAALGARRIAVVRAVTEAGDPGAVVKGLREALEARPRVLTVAGSDSGGGAGIQADIKAITRAGGFPLVAVTALTAQTTTGVHGVVGTPPAFVRDQIRLVAADIGLDGVKTGMLGTPETVAAVAAELAALDEADEIPVVVDPVMRAEAGSALLAPGGDDAYRTLLLARATVITPNLYEAQALAGLEGVDDASRLAQVLHERHGCAVIVTGGHGATADDVLCDSHGLTRIEGIRLERRTTHGAGCTHSATLAALLARGLSLREAAAGAKSAATEAVRHGLPYGAGAGPVDVYGGV
jgi:hydroxymethylpyrimidine kinase/phosphomethylpyrimidine kinase/thiamine-phosphate diphosphorylase